MPTARQTNLFIFLACNGIILVALFMQNTLELKPCYLCITQRGFIILTGTFSLLAFLHNYGIKVYGGLITLSALAGGFFSGKQIWLQNLPEDQVPACGPPVEYLFDAFNFSDALSMLFRGDGNCAEVQWTFLNLSIPAWALLCFLGLAALGLWQMIRES